MFNTSNSVLFCLSVSFIVILNLSRAHNKLEDWCCNRRGNIPKCHEKFCHERHHCYEDKFSNLFQIYFNLLEKSENNSPQHSHQTHTTIQQIRHTCVIKHGARELGVRGGVGWRVRKWAGVGVGYTCETIHGTLYVVLRDVKQYMAS